jgi:hypothetical protein
VYLFPGISQRRGQHIFNLGVNILDLIANPEFTCQGHFVYPDKFVFQLSQFFFRDQVNAPEHSCMGNAAENVPRSKKKVCLPVSAGSEFIYTVVGTDALFPKLHVLKFCLVNIYCTGRKTY